jgi:hypothetical protein
VLHKIGNARYNMSLAISVAVCNEHIIEGADAMKLKPGTSKLYHFPTTSFVCVCIVEKDSVVRRFRDEEFAVRIHSAEF